MEAGWLPTAYHGKGNAQLKALLVEDDTATRLLLEGILRKKGLEVRACPSAEEALTLLQEEFAALIFLDIHLPGMSGLELCHCIRQSEQGDYYYILVGTANNRADDLKQILEAGANDYIAKPYQPSLLDVRLSVAEAQIREISSRKRLESELKFLASHDPLTKLHNRNQLEKVIGGAIEQARRGISSFLLYLDLDNFKLVNDTLGHNSGDRLLVELARILKESCRSDDFLVRFGGDEFVIVFREVEEATAMQIAERIRHRLDKFVFSEKGKIFHLATSIGIVPIDSSQTPAQILATADSACYAAKANGRNRVELRRNETRRIARMASDADWSSRIREAIQKNFLALWFQPIIGFDKRSILYHEALIRYIGPSSPQPIAPQTFLGALERAGQLVQLDRFVISNAMLALKKSRDLTLAVNLSGLSFGDDYLPQYVIQQLELHGVEAERLILEVTESELIKDLDHAAGLIQRLQKEGVRFAMDDFGSGFCALSYLKNLPVNILKIDGVFVQGLPEQPFNQVVIQAILTIAKKMGIVTVAECVETGEEFELLAELGIDYAQGYFVAEARQRPYQLSELSKNLASRKSLK
ncbi:MAG: hypothetical protein C5B47_02745 [Verrucomicrobia bacterium]|nr:MAG: hypothetical protein C5B47_02745 [Verrucomicrobiota bacterium]